MKLKLVLISLLLPALAHAQQAGPYFRLKLQSSHFVPPSGYVNIWAKTANKHVYRTDSSGTDTDLTDAGGGGGGGGTTQTIDVINATAATGKTLTSAVADSGTNTGFVFNNSTALTATRKLASFQNNAVNKLIVRFDGSLDAAASTSMSLYVSGDTTPQITVNSQFGSGVPSLQWGGPSSSYYIYTSSGAMALNVSSTRFKLEDGTGFYISSGTGHLGAASFPFQYAVLGALVASRPTCDSTTRGALMPVYAIVGALDTLQICQKDAANAYAWHTVTVP